MSFRRLWKFATAVLIVRLVVARSTAQAAAISHDSFKSKFDASFLPDFWGGSGARLPTKEFAEAVQAATFGVVDGRSRLRRLVILSLVSEFSFRGLGLWELFLSNLRNITFTRRDGAQDHLANHLVAVLMTTPNATAADCNRLSNTYGARCVTITSPIFTGGNYGYKTLPYYGLSFAKVLTILNALTLGVDVLFLDGDQVFFRNPLPYILGRDIDVLVTGDCGARDDVTPAARFPKINTNIGFLYFRSTAMVSRAVHGWLSYLVRKAGEARPVLDQGTFASAMEFVSSNVGPQHMSVGMVLPDFFPHRCMAPCGCDTVGLKPGKLGRKLYRFPNGTCNPEFVQKWYHFHVPCNGDMNDKATALLKFLSIYERLVGPINSLSSPLDAV